METGLTSSLEWFWRLTALDGAPWILSALLVGLALIIWLQFKRRINRLVQALDQMIAVVQSADGQSAFKQRFGQLFAELAQNPMLGEVWRAYASTIVQNQTNANAVGYTRRPLETFNEQVVTAAGIDLRFYGSIPNLLVGMGLLFSFIGLVSALYFASSGVAAASVGAAQAALGELLAVATFKFLTSIAGLASSLVFSWGEKRQLYRIQHRLQRLCSLLEARMVPVTSESLMLAQLERTRSIENHLNRLSRSVYVRVPEALEETLASELRDALQPLHQAIAKAASEFHMPAPVPIQLPETVAPQTARTAQTVQPTQTPEPSATTVMPKRMSELAALADDRFGRAIGVISGGLERLTGSGHKARALALSQTLEETLDKLRDARQTVRAMHEELADGQLDIHGAMTAIEDVDKSLVATRENLRQASFDQPQLKT